MWVLFKCCGKCGVEKTPELFHKNTVCEDGLSAYCRDCSRRLYANKHKKYYEENKPILLEKNRLWKKNNPDRYKAQRKRYNQQPQRKIRRNFKKRIKELLQNRTESTHHLLGCSGKELAAHLESKFRDGMTWENYGVKGWHMDHIVPCAAFDLTDPNQRKQCFHYSNLQPLWCKENLNKGIKVSEIDGNHPCVVIG